MEPAEAQALYDRAKKAIEGGRASMGEGHRLLYEVRPHVTNARARGQVNQMIWDCEKLAGRRSMYFSQAGQDAYLDDKVFKGKRDGTFAEIGGYDGITGSNCLFFEMIRGWSGVVVEPAPTYFAHASSFRRVPCLQVAVAGGAGEAEFLEITEGFTQMSGLANSYDDRLREQVTSDPRHKGKTITVETRTLPQILDAQGMTEVDFISLDVEGGEMAILSGFPFEKYRVTAWTIENNVASTEIPQLMDQKGYARVEALGVDDIYVLKS